MFDHISITSIDATGYRRECARILDVLSLSARDAFVESLSLLMKHYRWSYQDLGAAIGKSRQWAYMLKTEDRKGTNLRALDEVCAAFTKADPPLVLSPADLLEPDRIRGKIGLTTADRLASNTPLKPTQGSVSDVVAAVERLQADSRRLESARLHTASVLFDLYSALHRHVTGDTRDGDSVAAPLPKAARPGKKPRASR